MKVITAKAFAKINLSLRITAKRADGFHDVQTILQAVDLFDRLTLERRRGPFEIRCAAPRVPTDRTNLVWRAAQRLWRAGGRDGEPRDVRVTLEKRIPMQAGLGGGSSDAAAALPMLRDLWKLQVSDRDLVAIGAGLGSDIPFFFVGGTALGLGRGDEIYPLDRLPRWWVVLVFPPFGVATADAYEWLDQMRARAPVAGEARRLGTTWLGSTVPLVNDLETPVIERHPVIGTLIERLSGLGASLAAMSGSGSTVFGIFVTSAGAQKALGLLRRTGANAICVRLLPRPAPRKGSRIL